jgi:hypothetical protein
VQRWGGRVLHMHHMALQFGRRVHRSASSAMRAMLPTGRLRAGFLLWRPSGTVGAADCICPPLASACSARSDQFNKDKEVLLKQVVASFRVL